MSETSETLSRKIAGASDVGTVVRTMKGIAASNINQFEMAVASLGVYYRTVDLGIIAYFRQQETVSSPKKGIKVSSIAAIVFGSDIGLVGEFNDQLADFVTRTLGALPGKKQIWPVGERIQLQLKDAGLATTKLFIVPHSVAAITPLVDKILTESEQSREKDESAFFYIFHNRPKKGSGYEPVSQRLFPLDDEWRQGMKVLKWPTKNLPQIVGEPKSVLSALIREYLFISLFRACAESMASENAARLAAMQRADKKINELLDDLSQQFNRMRQDSIDEELFDVISGFEALQEKK